MIFENYQEIKNLLYGINEKYFVIDSINSSNNFLKMSDLGLRKKKKIMIEIVVDLKFEEYIFRDGQKYFKHYEIAKKHICTKLEQGTYTNIKSRNYGVDIHDDTNNLIFRIHLFSSFILSRPLMQITDFRNTIITSVDNIEDIKKLIYRPLISSLILVYARKFPSFHIALKICKIWMMSKGFYLCDELVEHVVFYIFQKEFEQHNEMNTFFEKDGILVQSQTLANYSEFYNLFYSKQEEAYQRELINKNSKAVSSKQENNKNKNENAAKLSVTQNPNTMEMNKRKGGKRKRGNINEKESKKKKKNNNNNNNNNKEDYTNNDKHISTFSISSKTILIKFLYFLVNFQWTQKPLIIDFDGNLQNCQKKKIWNSFLIRKKKIEKQMFWVSSIYDPHCILITLPHNAFYAIINQAKYTLQVIKNLYNHFEKQKWMTLFMMEQLPWDICLKFKTPQQVYYDFKANEKGQEREKERKEKKEEIKEKQELEETEEQQTKQETEKEMDNNEIVYDLSYIHNVKEECLEISTIMKQLNEMDYNLIYKKYFENFIINLEQKFESQINILYNPICFENILNVNNFKNNIKRKLKSENSLPKEKCDFEISWKTNVLLLYNPFTINIFRRTNSTCTNLFNSEDKNNDVFITTNFSLLMYYIKSNTHSILKTIKLPHLLQIKKN